MNLQILQLREPAGSPDFMLLMGYSVGCLNLDTHRINITAFKDTED